MRQTIKIPKRCEANLKNTHLVLNQQGWAVFSHLLPNQTLQWDMATVRVSRGAAGRDRNPHGSLSSGGLFTPAPPTRGAAPTLREDEEPAPQHSVSSASSHHHPHLTPLVTEVVSRLIGKCWEIFWMVGEEQQIHRKVWCTGTPWKHRLSNQLCTKLGTSHYGSLCGCDFSTANACRKLTRMFFTFQIKSLQGQTLISFRFQFWSRISYFYLIILKSKFLLGNWRFASSEVRIFSPQLPLSNGHSFN